MPLMINHVWFGNNAMGPLEKFNIYSWRALGHSVTIYACRWDNTSPVDTVGVKEKNVTVVNLRTLLNGDDESKAAILTNTRALLKAWLEAAGGAAPQGDGIYNLVDVTKSYIGGTQRGIVLDLKVGPSSHLSAYEAAFSTKFISYTRGGNTAGDMPENQCIGTMEQGNTLRGKYATSFEKGITANLDGNDGLLAKPTAKWFDQITGYHGRAAFLACKYLDVATKAPDGKAVGNQYEVQEIGPKSHGPFRIFKRASDQSNKSGLKTKPKEVKELAQWVWDNELKEGGGDQHFLKKVEKALQALPG